MIIFGVVLILLAVQMLLDFSPKPSRTLPSNGAMAATGTAVGWLSALVGIGGGSMVVPFSSGGNQSIRAAIATGAACGLPVALAGTVGFAVAGWGKKRADGVEHRIHLLARLPRHRHRQHTGRPPRRKTGALPADQNHQTLLFYFLVIAGGRILMG